MKKVLIVGGAVAGAAFLASAARRACEVAPLRSLLQIGNLEAGPLAEMAQPGPERPEAGPGAPALGLETLDLGRERLRRGDRPITCDPGRPLLSAAPRHGCGA